MFFFAIRIRLDPVSTRNAVYCYRHFPLFPLPAKGSIGFIPFLQRLVHSVFCELSVSIHRGSAKYAVRRIVVALSR